MRRAPAQARSTSPGEARTNAAGCPNSNASAVPRSVACSLKADEEAVTRSKASSTLPRQSPVWSSGSHLSFIHSNEPIRQC